MYLHWVGMGDIHYEQLHYLLINKVNRGWFDIENKMAAATCYSLTLARYLLIILVFWPFFIARNDERAIFVTCPELLIPLLRAECHRVVTAGQDLITTNRRTTVVVFNRLQINQDLYASTRIRTHTQSCHTMYARHVLLVFNQIIC